MIMASKFTYKTSIPTIGKSLDKISKERRTAAAKMITREIKKNIKENFDKQSGTLLKSTTYRNLRTRTLVGIAIPEIEGLSRGSKRRAYPTALEHGTIQRRTAAGENRGRIVPPRPFVQPAFRDTSTNVGIILGKSFESEIRAVANV
jgi:hypothetical protein